MPSVGLQAQLLREVALRNIFCPETHAVTEVPSRHSEFSAAEIDAVRRLVGRSIAAVERELICETLLWRAGNRTHAATVLGISIRALRNKIRAYRMRGRGVPEPNLAFAQSPMSVPAAESSRRERDAVMSE